MRSSRVWMELCESRSITSRSRFIIKNWEQHQVSLDTLKSSSPASTNRKPASQKCLYFSTPSGFGKVLRLQNHMETQLSTAQLNSIQPDNMKLWGMKILILLTLIMRHTQLINYILFWCIQAG